MAKEKKSFKFRFWILVVFFYVADEIDRSWIDTDAGGGILVLGLFIIIPIGAVILGKLGQKQFNNTDGQKGNSTTQVDGKDSSSSRSQAVKEIKQQATTLGEKVKKIDNHEMPNEQIDGTKNRIYIPQHKNGASHNYSLEELKSNYAPVELIKKDDMTGSETNPFSLDGK